MWNRFFYRVDYFDRKEGKLLVWVTIRGIVTEKSSGQQLGNNQNFAHLF